MFRYLEVKVIRIWDGNGTPSELKVKELEVEGKEGRKAIWYLDGLGWWDESWVRTKWKKDKWFRKGCEHLVVKVG